ncbi:MAG: hypothetical protein HQ498_01705 [Pseudohongiella sp.]|nr:hypothetical protein [Pseudohongiella sp.]
MNTCINCKLEAEVQVLDAGNRLLIKCAACGTYDISRSAISRVNRNRSEKRRFATALRRAQKANKPLLVTVEPKIGLRFKDGGNAS